MKPIHVLLGAPLVLLTVAAIAATTYNTSFSVKKTKVGPKDNLKVDLLGVFDLGAGSTLIVMLACGTQLEFTATLPELESKAFEKFVLEQLDKACK